MAVNKIVLRPAPSLTLTLFLSSTQLRLLSSTQLRLLSSPASATLSICRRPTSAVASLSSQSQTLNSPPLPLYGPSLRKGSNLPIKPRIADSESDDDGGQIDEESFTRVFDVSAIRLRAKDCFLLEERLRGHLLNWPRIRNIARVPGDDVEERFLDLATKEETTGLDSLERRMYGRADGDGERLSSVLYRDKLVKSFDSNGFVNFKNVAKMSRPPRRKKNVVVVDEKVRKLGERNKDGRNGFALVEVVEDADGDEGGNWSGLLGDDCYSGVRWRGPTRLLLLDESYANKGVDELPEAIKVSVPFPLFCNVTVVIGVSFLKCLDFMSNV